MIDLAREASFSLGGHDARPSTRELVIQGQPRVVEPRVMQVLVALARRRGEVVSRDDLIGRLRRHRLR
jgi:DNA-binding winged helix-turn-helix (wHTH) protein